MARDEMWDRYERARERAVRAMVLMNAGPVYGLRSRAEDAVDMLETALLWRTLAEGGTVTSETMEQLVEATDE